MRAENNNTVPARRHAERVLGHGPTAPALSRTQQQHRTRSTRIEYEGAVGPLQRDFPSGSEGLVHPGNGGTASEPTMYRLVLGSACGALATE